MKTRGPEGLLASFVTVAVLSLPALLTSRAADAIVVRHDRDAQAFIALARKFPCTVTFRAAADRGAVSGMGTLVDARWVLTAAHVADALVPGDIVQVGGGDHEVGQVVRHPQWQGLHRWEDVQKDVAMVRLRAPVTGVTPARIYTGDDESGLTATFVGRGCYGTGLTGPVAYDATLRAATNRVEKADGPLLEFRFDRPGQPDVTPLEGISGDGDSGGPAYIERDGLVYVIGVSSSQDDRPANKKPGHYGVLEYYPRVSHFAEWIRATIEPSAMKQAGPEK